MGEEYLNESSQLVDEVLAILHGGALLTQYQHVNTPSIEEKVKEVEL